VASSSHAWVPATPNPHAYDRYKMHRNFVQPGQYSVDRNFLDFGSPAHTVGWKLHVVEPSGLDLDHYHLPQNYKQLLSYLRNNNIPHKIVGNLAGIEEMARDGQHGKFITIYPNDSQQLTQLVNQIEVLIGADATHPNASNDLAVGTRGLVSARWGGLTSKLTVNQQGQLVEDERLVSHPDWVRNPFAGPGHDGPHDWKDFDRYEIRAAQLKLKRGY
jgi:hypothetical protein